MAGVLQRLGEGARVAIVRLRSLGDCVLTTPALSILKLSRPDLKIAVVVEPRFASVFDGNRDVDEILGPKLIALRRWRSELCLNFHGGTRSAWLTGLSGARWRAGFGHHSCASIYNVRIPRAQAILGVERVVHTAEHLASAMFYLGATSMDVPRARVFARGEGNPAPRPYAVIHPAASRPDKTWPAARFAEAAGRLRSEFGLEPVFIGGPDDDLSPFRGFQVLTGQPLDRIKSLLRDAALFIGNDSGPAHLAAASGLPVVVLFGGSDREVWGPWKALAEVLWNDSGIQAIQTGEVLQALTRLRVHA